ncbi:MAG: asparagine N-glycosylation enzyme membrane subunit Stt3 [Planctomycetota bacterium]|jgi:asparagine N-glycosylation enzyme membrane subunit Stt3
MRVVAGVLLALILGAAFVLREATAPGYKASAEAQDLPTWLVDDPDAAYHLRRVELALASGQVPGFDRYINHPEGSPIPWPPFSDGLFGVVASLFADGDPLAPDDLALGGYSEDSVESVLVHLPPALGVLTCLAIFAAIWVLCERGPLRAWFALFGAAIYAVLPIAVWYGGITRLDHHVVVALLLALHLGLITWSLRAKNSLDALTGALGAGVIAGMAIASWLAAGIFVSIAGFAFFLRVCGSDEERARFGTRAAVLYFAAAAGVTLFPAASSAWNESQPGSLINLTSGVPRALFAAIVPFVVVAFARRRLGPSLSARIGSALLAVLSVSGVLWFLPGFVDGVNEGIQWASRGNLFMDVVAESRPLDSLGLIASQLTYLALLFPWMILAIVPAARKDAARVHLVLLGLAMAWMTLGQQRFGNTLAIPFACVLALGFHDLTVRFAATRLKKPLLAIMGVSTLLLLPSFTSVFAPTEDEYRDLADWRSEIVRGLRWMRTETPSPGPWNAPKHRGDYGVLASWGLGHMIEYHARRPSITTNFGSFVGERNFTEAARALLETEPTELARRMRILDAKYVIVTPRHIGDLKSTMRIAGEDPSLLFERSASGAKRFSSRTLNSAIWKLAFHDAEVGSQHYPGLELVWASKRMETESGSRPQPGRPFGPVLSIYRLLEHPDRAAGTRIEAPRD